MSSKRWFVMFILTLLLLPVMWAACNFIVDPFGVFGSDFLSWTSFSETMNPRVGKFMYLEEHHDEYDSYIIGCSSTSSYPVEDLNEYLNADFYNLIMYGADMWDVEKITEYITENYTVKNLVLNLYVDNGQHYNEGEDLLTDKLHYKVSGASGLSFYGGYMFSSLNYAFDKLSALKNDTILAQSFDVFDEQTGAYDKRSRDIENIGDMRSYLEAYPVFADYPLSAPSMDKIDECMESVAAIKKICEERGVNFYAVCAPVYAEYLQYFDPQELAEFYTKLAGVTPFYDFTYSSISCDPRYFYDATHFRNFVGDMASGYMFGDDSVYMPEDFGEYVTEENAEEHAEWLAGTVSERRFEERLNSVLEGQENEYTAELPVLMYHNIAGNGDGSVTVTAESFESQMKTLAENGYTAVTLDDLYDFVYSGAELPDKPVLITFDDGYMSNYEIAWPILEKYGMKAVIFAIGVSVGKDTYKDTGIEITPHFSYEQAKEMIDSGVISVQTHTYDMHQNADYERLSNGAGSIARTDAVKLEDESEQAFADAFAKDLQKGMNGIEEHTGQPVTALAYPNGRYSELSQAVCRSAGIKATFTVEGRVNTLIKGLPQCLYGLGRYNVDDISGQELLDMIE